MSGSYRGVCKTVEMAIALRVPYLVDVLCQLCTGAVSGVSDAEVVLHASNVEPTTKVDEIHNVLQRAIHAYHETVFAT